MDILTNGIPISPNVQKALAFFGQLAVDVAAKAAPTDDTPYVVTMPELFELAGSRLPGKS